MITYLRLIRNTVKQIGRADAEYLLQTLSRKNLLELYSSNECVPQGLYDRITHLVQKCRDGAPVQYLVHTAYFLDYELYVDQRVMIPRFETEELVVKTVSRIKFYRRNPRLILDVGTGSGNIAIALANLLPMVRIIATDISHEALQVASYNVKKYHLEKRVALINCNLLEFAKSSLPEEFKTSNSRFDVIISNPPYIPTDELAQLPISVRNYEPRLALDGGQDGFEIIKKLLITAQDYLKPSGFLALEIDPRQVNLITGTVRNASIEFEHDLRGNIRYAFVYYK
ncbi:MAG: peptide chain release factor N(5)-glutamine methyltransferase [candidate division WOR-3 bacterium]